jgi:hypothetical protein
MVLLVMMPVLGADYRVQVFMPLTGQEAAPVAQTSQWKQVASLAAQEVTSSWNDGDNLIVEYLDTASSTLKTVELGLVAANDPTVKVVVTVAMRSELVHELSRLLHFYNVRWDTRRCLPFCLKWSLACNREAVEQTTQCSFFFCYVLDKLYALFLDPISSYSPNNS